MPHNWHKRSEFRTSADNWTWQICYYNRNKSDTSFNSFLATREQTWQKGVIKFSIDKVITILNSTDVNYLELGDKFKNINNDSIQSKLQQVSGGNLIRGWSKSQNRDRQRTKQRENSDRHGQVSKKPRFLSG